jgi:hypothetical protein
LQCLAHLVLLHLAFSLSLLSLVRMKNGDDLLRGWGLVITGL